MERTDLTFPRGAPDPRKEGLHGWEAYVTSQVLVLLPRLQRPRVAARKQGGGDRQAGRGGSSTLGQAQEAAQLQILSKQGP